VAKLPVSPEERAGQALLEGDLRTALTVLMECYGDEIYRHCRQVVGNDDLAADVQQTVFVQAYRDLARFAGRSSFRTWLYAIARNRCLDALKAQKRRRFRFRLGTESEDRPDPRPDVRAQLQSQSEARAIDRALESLKPEVRIAVLLRYREDMSYEEMAEVCGERAATLQARVKRAMPKLKQALNKAGGAR
jgi:RNA polymerase sigma-70 factor (ECF subfamily)